METRTKLPTDESAPARFARLPAMLRLATSVLLGPSAALVNQGIIYIAMIWACGPGSSLALHLIPLLCLAAAVAAGFIAYADWTRVGRGVQVDGATVDDRSRFLALAGMGASALSALVIVAQWVAIFVFGPCMRA